MPDTFIKDRKKMLLASIKDSRKMFLHGQIR
jgi:hypothetical protein